MVGCDSWICACVDFAIEVDKFGNWNIQSVEDYTEHIIEYCPFCGSELNEKGCTDNDRH